MELHNTIGLMLAGIAIFTYIVFLVGYWIGHRAAKVKKPRLPCFVVSWQTPNQEENGLHSSMRVYSEQEAKEKVAFCHGKGWISWYEDLDDPKRVEGRLPRTGVRGSRIVHSDPHKNGVND